MAAEGPLGTFGVVYINGSHVPILVETRKKQVQQYSNADDSRPQIGNISY